MASKKSAGRSAKTSKQTSGKRGALKGRAAKAPASKSKAIGRKAAPKASGPVKPAAKKSVPKTTSVVKRTSTKPVAKKPVGSASRKPATAAKTPPSKPTPAVSKKSSVQAGASRTGSAKPAAKARPARTGDKARADEAKKTSSKASNAAARHKVIAAAARTSHNRAVSVATEWDASALESISVIRRPSNGTERDRNGHTSRKKQYTARELEKFRAILLRVRGELEQQVESLRSSSLTREDWVNSEEDGTDAFERQLALNLASTEGDSIFAIDQALKRIDEGIYGSCEECGCLIGRERLKALPFVQLCIACKSESEKRRLVSVRTARRV